MRGPAPTLGLVLGLALLAPGCPYVSRAEIEAQLELRDDDGDGVSVADELRAGTDAGLEIGRHDTTDPEFKLPALLDDLAGGALFATGRLVVVRGAEPPELSLGRGELLHVLPRTNPGRGELVGARFQRAGHIARAGLELVGLVLLLVEEPREGGRFFVEIRLLVAEGRDLLLGFRELVHDAR